MQQQIKCSECEVCQQKLKELLREAESVFDIEPDLSEFLTKCKQNCKYKIESENE